jgi:inorganic pyrophosphatase
MSSIMKFLEKANKFELDAYRKFPHLARDYVAFTGAPQKHPFRDDRVLLVADPFSSQAFYYEFDLTDVEGVEMLPKLVTTDGESITMARLWVKKGSIGIRSNPFVVADTSETVPGL